MSWLFSLALAVEYSAVNCSDGEQSAQLNVMPTQHKFWRNDKTMEFSRLSQFGLTLNLLTESRGEELLTSYLAAFPVRTSVSQERAQESREIVADCGQKWRGSLAKYDRVTCSWKTAQLSLLEESGQSLEIWSRWGSIVNGVFFPVDAQEPQLKENGFLLPAPTKAMGKRGWGISSVKPRYQKAIEDNARLFGYKPHPSVLEWSMGWIPTWTRLAPLAMGKFQSWQQQHFHC